MEQPPLDNAALATITSAQRLLGGGPPVRLPMTHEEKRDAENAIKKGALCLFCAGIHVGASTPACPRLSSGKLNGDGTVVEFTFWEHWDQGRVIFPEDIEDDADETE